MSRKIPIALPYRGEASQPCLFVDEELLPSGTKIKELKKYIGVKVEAVDASAYYTGHKKGTVSFIEKTEVNGYPNYRVELGANNGALNFGNIEDIHDFFKSDLKLTEVDFRILCKNKKVCFVSTTDNESLLLYKQLKNITNAFASISIEGIHKYDDCELYSLNRKIHYRGYKIKRVTFLKDNFYQITKEKEGSKIFHIIKNGELRTSCGKELNTHIDTQDISDLASVCCQCEKIFNENYS